MGLTDRSREYQYNERQKLNTAKLGRETTSKLDDYAVARISELRAEIVRIDRLIAHWAKEEARELQTRNYPAAKECEGMKMQLLSQLNSAEVELSELSE